MADKNYLCFEAVENTDISFVKNGTFTTDLIILYSTNNGQTWNNYTFGNTIHLSVGQKCYWKGDNNSAFSKGSTNYIHFASSFKVKASGNIMSLLDSSCESLIISFNYCFTSMFKNCTSLTQAPELPATTLADYCYYDMFQGCTSLTQAPELPAITLADNCYDGMFWGCTSLTQAPELPATTLAYSCYGSMFGVCTSLAQAPELPATTLADYCYVGMFWICTSLTQAPELPATTLVPSCYYNMFYGCTSLTQAPELPATTLANGCYGLMFNGCTSLTQAPELPATTLADNCYDGMFQGCTSLVQVPELPATKLTKFCYREMFKNCVGIQISESKIADYTIPYRIPSNGTGSTELTYFSLNNMFSNTGGGFKGTPEINKTYYVKEVFKYDITVDATKGQLDSTASTPRFYTKGTSIKALVNPKGNYAFADYLLKDYTRLEYITGDGVGSYINTNIYQGYEKFIIELTASFSEMPVRSRDKRLFGSTTGSKAIYMTTEFSAIFNTTATVLTAPQLNKKVLFRYEETKGYQKYSIDNNYVETHINEDISTSLPLYLFSCNYMGGGSEYVSSYNFHDCKIYKGNNNDLVGDLIPVKRNSDNEIGVLNLVDFSFKSNSGTGSLIAGPIYDGEVNNIRMTENPLLFSINNNTDLQTNFRLDYQIDINYDSSLGNASYRWTSESKIKLMAEPKVTSQFLGWYRNGTRFSTELITEFTVSGNTTIECRFERIYDISTSVIGNGSVNFIRNSDDKNLITFTAVPIIHNSFNKYEINGVVHLNNPLTIKINNDAEVLTTFIEDPKYIINVKPNIKNASVYISDNNVYSGTPITLWARPFSNYKFTEWSDGDTSNPRTITVTDNITLTANYTRVTESNGIYQYRCYIKDQLSMTSLPKAFAVVEKFNINEDYLTTANSTIEVLKMPEEINNGDVIVVYDPKGTTVYQGVITSISELKITASQIQSFYKGLWIYHNYSSATYVEEEVAYLFNEYAQGKVYNAGYIDPLIAQRLGGITIRHTNSTTGKLPTDLNQNGEEQYTEWDMEKFIYKLYQDYGIVFEFTINISGPNYVDIKVPNYQSLTIGNNHYAIMNLSPMQTVEETNKLIIYWNSTVAGQHQAREYRTTYIATKNGIVEAPTSLANRFEITNTVVVFSDDNIADLVTANLPNTMYNHKITFDLFLKNELYQFDEFKLGMPLVIWHNGTDYYNSVLTGRSFAKDTNKNISEVLYTCGLVRTALTKKLTLNKL